MAQLADSRHADEVLKLKAQRDELVAALEHYGRHRIACFRSMPYKGFGSVPGKECVCGLSAVIANAKSGQL